MPHPASDDGSTGSSLHLIVPHPVDPSILVRMDATGAPRLPETVGPTRLGDLAPIIVAIADCLGREVTILRIAPLSLTPEHRAGHVLIEIEPLTDATPPADCTWLAHGDLLVASLGPPEIGAALDRWLIEQRTGTPMSRRPPWSRRGFVDRASGWIVDRLVEVGTPAVAPPYLAQLWGLSAILQAETPAGIVFMKACAKAFPYEVSITAAVDRVAPGVGPAVVAREDAEGWLLMRDVGGAALGEAPLERWADGLSVLGGLQRIWPDAEGAIVLEDRGPGTLAASIPGLVEDPMLDALPDETRERLRLAVPRLLDACERITRLGPGPSLVHGDFHPWNVHRSQDRTSIIDWSDSCSGHPFFDLVTFVGRTQNVEARRAMVANYLDGWSAHGSRAALEEAARLALPLGALHQVESYRRIVASLEPDDRWDLEEGGQSHARDAVAWLEAGIAAEGA